MESDRGVHRVLVCDDTASIRYLIRINLELEGHHVEEAASVRQALARLEDPDRPLPDVLLLDAHMAPLDGWWLISELRSRPELDDLPVILVSAALHGLDHGHAQAAGFDAVLAKPFDPDDLLDLVSSIAASGRGVREGQ